MRRTAFFAGLAMLLLALSLSACVVEPCCEHYHGHDDGHRVWHD